MSKTSILASITGGKNLIKPTARLSQSSPLSSPLRPYESQQKGIFHVVLNKQELHMESNFKYLQLLRILLILNLVEEKALIRGLTTAQLLKYLISSLTKRKLPSPTESRAPCSQLSVPPLLCSVPTSD